MKIDGHLKIIAIVIIMMYNGLLLLMTLHPFPENIHTYVRCGQVQGTKRRTWSKTNKSVKKFEKLS